MSKLVAFVQSLAGLSAVKLIAIAVILIAMVLLGLGL